MGTDDWLPSVTLRVSHLIVYNDNSVGLESTSNLPAESIIIIKK